MLIGLDKLSEFGVVPKGVIHVGMHKAEEFPAYVENKIEDVLFIEANQQLINGFGYEIPEGMNVSICCAAVSDCEEEVTFTITNNGMSSSILELADHSEVYPHIVAVQKVNMTTTVLDKILSKVDPSKFNILNIDIQGAELKAMRGMSDWSHIQAVYTEVNYREMYVGCSKLDEITEFLSEKGFSLVENHDTGCGWGDALYIKQ